MRSGLKKYCEQNSANVLHLFECEKRIAHLRSLCDSQFVVANHHLAELVLLLQSLLSKVALLLPGHSILFEAADSNELIERVERCI